MRAKLTSYENAYQTRLTELERYGAKQLWDKRSWLLTAVLGWLLFWFLLIAVFFGAIQH